MNQHQFTTVFLVLSSCFFMVTIANDLEIDKRNIRSNSELGPLSMIRSGLVMLEDVYLPVFIGRKLTGQSLETLGATFQSYCGTIHPSWDQFKAAGIANAKANLKGNQLEFLERLMDEAKRIIDDSCANQKQVLEFAANGKMDCVITNEKQFLPCYEKLSLDLNAISQSPDTYVFPSKEKIQEATGCIIEVFKKCSA